MLNVVQYIEKLNYVVAFIRSKYVAALLRVCIFLNLLLLLLDFYLTSFFQSYPSMKAWPQLLTLGIVGAELFVNGMFFLLPNEQCLGTEGIYLYF